MILHDQFTPKEITCSAKTLRRAENLLQAARREVNSTDVVAEKYDVIATIREEVLRQMKLEQNHRLENAVLGILEAAEILKCEPSLVSVLASGNLSNHPHLQEIALRVKEILATEKVG